MSDSTNTVKFTGSCIKNVKFIDGSLYVTGGEPTNPNPTVTNSGDTWSVSVDCEREGSSTTANKYNQQITAGGKYHEFGLLSDVSTFLPSKLNLFFQVEITMQHSNGDSFEFKNKVWMGQGHTGLRNNWWIGGMNMINLGSTSAQYLQLTVPTEGHPIFIPMIEGIISVSGESSSSADEFSFSLLS